MNRSMSNVTQLVLQAGPEDRCWESLQSRIRLFQQRLSDYDSTGDHQDILSPCAAEMSEFVAEIFNRLRALAGRLDALDNLISTLGNVEIQEILRKRAVLNREALVEVVSILSLEFERVLVRSEFSHLPGDQSSVLR